MTVEHSQLVKLLECAQSLATTHSWLAMAIVQCHHLLRCSNVPTQSETRVWGYNLDLIEYLDAA